jgi:putative RecB family exonuclease
MLSALAVILKRKVVMALAYSHSQLETYANCPFKYKLQYIDRKRTGRKSIEAFMGTRVHEALEKLYRDLRMSRLPELQELEEYYLERWDSSINDGIFVVKDEYEPEDYRQTGLRCIGDYYRRYHPFDVGVPVWLEKKVNIPIRDEDGGSISFTGILDRLDSFEDGRYEIHDYKTSNALPSQQELERDRQLSLYQLAVEAAYPDAQELELVWHYLVFDRELRLHREREDLEGVAAYAARMARNIEESEDFPARESILCDWCEYQEHCPKRKHSFMVTRLPARELGTDRGIQLVDKYAEWWERKKEAETHIKELREEALEFSDYHGVDNLQGSSRMLKITRSRQLKVPSSKSSERQELENILKEEGAWEDVSALNASRLSDAIEEGKLDESTQERLKEFIGREDVSTLRLY